MRLLFLALVYQPYSPTPKQQAQKGGFATSSSLVPQGSKASQVHLLKIDVLVAMCAPLLLPYPDPEIPEIQ